MACCGVVKVKAGHRECGRPHASWSSSARFARRSRRARPSAPAPRRRVCAALSRAPRRSAGGIARRACRIRCQRHAKTALPAPRRLECAVPNARPSWHVRCSFRKSLQRERGAALTQRRPRAGGLRAGVRRPPPCRTAGKTTGRESSRCGRRACSAHPRTGASVSHLTTPSPVSQLASQLAAARATVGSLVSLGLPCGWLACDWCPAPPWRCPTARHLIACAHLLMFVCVQAATRARGGCR